MAEAVYKLELPTSKALPILVSVPHAGTLLDEDMLEGCQDIIHSVGDTDWYVHELYKFCPEIGIPLIHANYSRWVVDLNRPLEGSASLYPKGRPNTGLIPLRTFDGEPLYKTGEEPSTEEKRRRIDHYYQPYYFEVQRQLDQLLKDYSQVLLFDGHSIRSMVPSLSETRFPDMILGNRKGFTCSDEVFHTALIHLRSLGYEVNDNHPFQGGNITRSFHNQNKRIQTLQLEMSQRLFMNETDLSKPADRFQNTSQHLRTLLTELSQVMLKVNRNEGANG